MTELARIVDPAALDRASLTTGRLALDVLPEWLDARATIVFVAPKRIACARCDGGGCDACARSGAFRIEGDDAARTLQLTLPAAPAVVRVAQPFAEGPELLLVELRPAATTTAAVVPRPRPQVWVVAAVILVAVVIAALLATR